MVNSAKWVVVRMLKRPEDRQGICPDGAGLEVQGVEADSEATAGARGSNPSMALPALPSLAHRAVAGRVKTIRDRTGDACWHIELKIPSCG